MAIGRVNTGGGGSGGTLTVTGIAGHTVTATKDGKTYTRTFDSSGVAVFKGLSTGTWTLTMTGDGQTATRTVDVNADYAVTITYFAATINVTYPANSKCTVTNKTTSETVGSDTNTGASEKTWACVVGAAGTYTITAAATDGSGKNKEKEVDITTDGQVVSVTLSYKLYQAGDTDTGFLSVGWPFSNGAHTGSPKIAYNTDSVVFTAPNGEGSTSGVVYFPDKIDLTPYTTLTADATLAGSINADARPEGLYIWSKIKSGYYQDDSVASALFGKTGKKILTIDVSKLIGEYYIGFGLRRELTPVETITLREANLE